MDCKMDCTKDYKPWNRFSFPEAPPANLSKCPERTGATRSAAQSVAESYTEPHGSAPHVVLFDTPFHCRS
jgi:hypothetical protein